ncbi:MAG TPA: hypothetical protein VFW22_17010 [Pseudolabrys sp.]|nr:hypothetical protein [Pseudolabrys sp.]
MTTPVAMQMRPASRQRLLEWVKVVLIVLAAGPPIGGVVFALVSAFLQRSWSWEVLPMALLGAPVLSYVVGLPIAAIALTLFLSLQFFISRGGIYLAVICGAVAAEFVVFLWDVISPSPLGVGGYIMGFVMFGIPSVVSAFICWRITRQLHRLP